MSGRYYSSKAVWSPGYTRYNPSRRRDGRFPSCGGRQSAATRNMLIGIQRARSQFRRAAIQTAKRAGVATRLTTKQGSLTRPITQSGALSSFGFFYPPAGRFAKFMRTISQLPVQSSLVTDSTRSTWGINVQSVTAFQTFTDATLNTIFTSRTANPTGVSHIGMLSCMQELHIANASNAGVWCDIYDIALKSDIGTGTFETNNIATPDNAFATGLVAMGTAAGNAAVGTTPFQSDYFTEFYRVGKVTRAFLPGGGVHRHRQTSIVNQYLDRAKDFATVASKGLMHWTMVVAHGQPANDTTNAALVGTSEGALNFVHLRTFKYVWIDDGAPQAIFTSGLDNVVADEMIEEETGAVANIITT